MINNTVQIKDVHHVLILPVHSLTQLQFQAGKQMTLSWVKRPTHPLAHAHGHMLNYLYVGYNVALYSGIHDSVFLNMFKCHVVYRAERPSCTALPRTSSSSISSSIRAAMSARSFSTGVIYICWLHMSLRDE